MTPDGFGRRQSKVQGPKTKVQSHSDLAPRFFDPRKAVENGGKWWKVVEHPSSGFLVPSSFAAPAIEDRRSESESDDDGGAEVVRWPIQFFA